jgi:ribosome-associated toxin RatA of RatAB toxin-antitoxin module
MHTTHEAVIRSGPEAIFALAADVERWPQLHPAYRWCRVLERTPSTVVFEMGGRIRGWPARWRARQERFPAQGRILFRHLGGLTRGMVVEWRLRPEGETLTHLRIDHEFVMSWPVVGRVVSDLIIGPVFIDWIARATLRGVRQLLE